MGRALGERISRHQATIIQPNIHPFTKFYPTPFFKFLRNYANLILMFMHTHVHERVRVLTPTFNMVVLGWIYNYLQNFIQIRSLDFAQSYLLNFDVLHVRVRERVRERVHVSASKLNQYLLGHI